MERPAQGLIHRSFLYQHPVYDHDAIRAQGLLWNLQGTRRTWFCGSYFGHGFHEDGLQAGLAVAEQLGGLERPWQVAEPNGRIHCHPRAVPGQAAARGPGRDQVRTAGPGPGAGGMSASALYVGRVGHRRHRPRVHRLDYRVFSLLLDLDELPDLGRRLRLFAHNGRALFPSWTGITARATAHPLAPHVRGLLARAGVHDADGPIRLLCYPRVLGFVFNPLSVYYCHGADGALRALIYEVNNTFGERHSYVIPVAGDGGPIRQTCRKVFYVSPFLPMDCTYHFRVTHPGGTPEPGHPGDPRGDADPRRLGHRRAPSPDRRRPAAGGAPHPPADPQGRGRHPLGGPQALAQGRTPVPPRPDPNPRGEPADPERPDLGRPDPRPAEPRKNLNPRGHRP